MPADPAQRLLRWWDAHGRKDLPWQLEPRDRYRIWVAEIMLQQTQVATVIGYYARFLERFPDVAALAAAPEDQVLGAWSGLGYYSRARNLHAAAQTIVAAGWPEDLDAWQALPGVGRSTAAAILTQADGQRHAILDGNVKRVLARHAGIEGWPGEAAVLRRLWEEAERRTPERRVADYTQAIMDLGATLCTARAPRCEDCPWQADCVARLGERIGRLPGRRPRRALPEREMHWLVVRGPDRTVLLRRRPPTGVWGGLWTPPEGADAEAISVLAGELGVTVTEQAAPLKHAFTHFRLTIHPHLAEVGTATSIADDGTTWFHYDDRSIGVPRPVQALLQRLG